MRQPDDCLAEIMTDPEPVPLPARDLAAGWMFLGLLIAVAIFEIWALMRDKNTISQMIQRLSRGRTWFKVLAVVGMSVLTWHIIWGFFW